MQITMLKAKLHRVTVTQVELEYEGSCAIDSRLLERAGIREYEQIHIYNIDNGERFITYAIRAEAASGMISVNGAAAHKARVNNRLIICSYALIDVLEVEQFKPALVYVDAHNRITRIRHQIPIQAA